MVRQEVGKHSLYWDPSSENNEGILFWAVKKMFAAKVDIECSSGGTTTVEIYVEMLKIYDEEKFVYKIYPIELKI